MTYMIKQRMLHAESLQAPASDFFPHFNMGEWQMFDEKKFTI